MDDKEKIKMLENEIALLRIDNKELRLLFRNALENGFETWIMDRARELGFSD